MLEISPKLSSISNISNWKENDKRKVFESIEKIQKIITPFEYSTQGVLPPINPESIQDINVNKLKYLLPYQFKDYGLAKLKLDEFRVHNSFSDEEQVVMSIVSDYLGLLSQGKSDEEAINILNNFFSKELIRKLKKEMQLMEELFNKEKTPFTCYDCNECNIINDCKLVELASVTAQINAEQKKNIINQESISQLLN